MGETVMTRFRLTETVTRVWEVEAEAPSMGSTLYFSGHGPSELADLIRRASKEPKDEIMKGRSIERWPLMVNGEPNPTLPESARKGPQP